MATPYRAVQAVRRHLLTVAAASPATLRNGSTHARIPASAVALRRGIASTSASAYPRQPLRRRTVVEDARPPYNVEEAIAEEFDASEPGTATSQEAPPRRLVNDVKQDAPWYLREQEAYEEEDDGIDGLRTPHAHDARLTQPDVDLPDVLQGLHQMLTEGPPSALVARPDDGVLNSETGQRPLHYIHARRQDPQSWCEWIMVVQVRSSAGSAVSRMAKEIGGFLRDKPPPSDEAEAEVQPPKPGHNANAKTTAWRPFKILSRDAQDGIRLLHANDPERWTRKTLAETFKMSVESVRRILNSRWQPPPSVVQRQNRRAHERRAEGKAESLAREDEDIAEIKASIAKSNGEEVDADDFAAYEDYRTVDDEGNVIEAAPKRHKQPITYEGLVGVSADGRSHDTANSSRGAKDAAGRGDGEWCLVDAGWCVVHVMTAKARTKYDVESHWRSDARSDYDIQGERLERDQRERERQREVRDSKFFRN